MAEDQGKDIHLPPASCQPLGGGQDRILREVQNRISWPLLRFLSACVTSEHSQICTNLTQVKCGQKITFLLNGTEPIIQNLLLDAFMLRQSLSLQCHCVV